MILLLALDVPKLTRLRCHDYSLNLLYHEASSHNCARMLSWHFALQKRTMQTPVSLVHDNLRSPKSEK
jgi:hypothetical protein